MVITGKEQSETYGRSHDRRGKPMPQILFKNNVFTDNDASSSRWSWAGITSFQRAKCVPHSRLSAASVPYCSSSHWRLEPPLRADLYTLSSALLQYLGDETGIADLSAAWDLDCSSSSLTGRHADLKRWGGKRKPISRGSLQSFGTGAA